MDNMIELLQRLRRLEAEIERLKRWQAGYHATDIINLVGDILDYGGRDIGNISDPMGHVYAEGLVADYLATPNGTQIDNTVTGNSVLGGDQVDVTGVLRAQQSARIESALTVERLITRNLTRDALMYLHLDGPLSSNTGWPVGHRGQAPTTPNATIHRPGKFGKAVQLAPSTVNYISANPSFESGDMTGWTLYGTQPSSGVDATLAEYGSYAFHCVCDQDDSGITRTETSVAASGYTEWTLSCSIYRIASNTPLLLSMVFHYDDATTSSLFYDSRDIPLNEWTRVYLSASADPLKTLASIEFNLFGWNFSPVIGEWYVDAVQLEPYPFPTPYCDGGLGNGHVWTGVANASTSTRAAASYLYTSSEIFGAAPGEFTIMGWAKVLSLTGGETRLIRTTNTVDPGKIWIEARSLQFLRAKIGDILTIDAGAYPLDEWFHFALTRDADGMATLYVDGVPGDSEDTSAEPMNTITGFALGDTSASTMNGWLDDVVVLDSALNAEEIVAVVNAGVPVAAGIASFEYVLFPTANYPTAWLAAGKSAANTGTVNVHSVFGVPLNAKAVTIAITFSSSTAGAVIAVGIDASNAYMGVYEPVANRSVAAQGTVPLDTSGNIYVTISHSCTVSMAVLGYYT